jgi:hypothetical protein
MPYEFRDVGDISCAQVARQFSELLVGRVAVNTSFDSGKLSRPDWETVNGFCVSPRITSALANDWPSSHEDAFCNFMLPIARYQELDFEGGCPLDRYLELFQPNVVFGCDARSAYLIRRDAPRSSVL